MRDGPRHMGNLPAMPHHHPPDAMPRGPAMVPSHTIPPHVMHPMANYGSPAPVPVRPSVMVPMGLPHPHPVHAAFGPAFFDPLLHPGDVDPGAPMSEEEFYRLQKKLKHKTDPR